ncbi:hypothetical protein Cyrtocomes_00974 [Candidatus Cyrtobacter comes]|uniref:Uncharacterized protein n=2 Tax=Candidatus Cyrtobacter comes TaxID=675776 RepID=A0ABU5L8Z0_9RICK|nr:hypothetical protein [Candidatus Cyrtobacter comes]
MLHYEKNMIDDLSIKLESMRIHTIEYLNALNIDREYHGTVLSILFGEISRIVNNVFEGIGVKEEHLTNLLQLLDDYEKNGLEITINALIGSATISSSQNKMEYRYNTDKTFQDFYNKFLNITYNILQEAKPYEVKSEIFLYMQESKIAVALGKESQDIYDLKCMITAPIMHTHMNSMTSEESILAKKFYKILLKSLPYLDDESRKTLESFLNSDSYLNLCLRVYIANDIEESPDNRQDATAKIKDTCRSGATVVDWALSRYMESTQNINQVTKLTISNLKKSCEDFMGTSRAV